MHTRGLPKGYGLWMMAAVLIVHTDICLTSAFQEIYKKHILRSNTEDKCIFITSLGYLEEHHILQSQGVRLLLY
jgi:hypothetical protein